MSLTDDIRRASKRFPQHVNTFVELFKKFRVGSEEKGWRVLEDREFRSEFNSVWQKVISAEGGKLGLTIMLGIIGAALGGAGLAVMGTAVPVSLALVGALAGLAIGNELDSEGHTATLIRKVKAFWKA